jgi:hypothetical protein
MAKNANSQDTQKVLALLRAALSDFDPKAPLARVFEKAPKCGPFEWMLCILSIEIDLRVDIPEKLADNRKLSALEFAQKVAALPRINSDTYTIECLALVAQALLALDLGGDGPESSSKTTRGARKGAKKATGATKAPKKAAGAKKAPPAAKKVATITKKASARRAR